MLAVFADKVDRVLLRMAKPSTRRDYQVAFHAFIWVCVAAAAIMFATRYAGRGVSRGASAAAR